MAIDRYGNFYYSFCNKPYLPKIRPCREIIETYDQENPELHYLIILEDEEAEHLWTIDLVSDTFTKRTIQGEIVHSIDRNALKLQITNL
ncbi:MAG: hypothetical protein MK193_04260 [Lentisphaeria bacterium]|nr:hypothetical protein [Lentisphaeria bacterium]